MTEPTARERLAERLCEAALHVHLIDENASWQAMWLRVADVALTEARAEVLAPIRALAEEWEQFHAERDGHYTPEIEVREAADRIRRCANTDAANHPSAVKPGRGSSVSMIATEPDSKTNPLSPDLDSSEITHAVCACQVDASPRLALCGTDCSDTCEGMTPTICVVCADAIRRAEPCKFCGGLD